jgi:hypothetical protein
MDDNDRFDVPMQDTIFEINGVSLVINTAWYLLLTRKNTPWKSIKMETNVWMKARKAHQRRTLKGFNHLLVQNHRLLSVIHLSLME